MPRRPLAIVFLVAALLQLVPIWAVNHLPTADGPSHLYNAWVMRELVLGTDDLIAQHYRIDWRPHPNWTGHVILAVLMFVVPPVVAEKLLLSILVLLFLAGAWMLAGANDERGRPYAFLAFPFAWHYMLQMGFYNFSLSVALYMIVIAVWWKRRDDPSLRTIAIVAALLLACYFSHPLSTALALGSIGLLWLLTRRSIRHLAAFLPVLPLMIWYTRQHGAATSEGKSMAELFDYLSRAQFLLSFEVVQMTLGRVLVIVFLVLALLTIAREKLLRRQADAFLVLTLVLLAGYFFVPDSFAGGQVIRERLALMLFLPPLAWFTPRLPSWLMTAFVAVLALLAIVNSAYLLRRYRDCDRVITPFVESATKGVAEDTTILPLIADTRTPRTFVSPLSHAISYAAIEKRLVNLGNYEPSTGYFPVAYRENAAVPALHLLGEAPAAIDTTRYAHMARYVFTWKVPDQTPAATTLAQQYALVAQSGDARVYRSRSAITTRLDDEIVLLPIAGTAGEIGGPIASWFRVDQHVRNNGTTPVPVLLNTCAATPCLFELQPSTTARLASNDPRSPYVFVRVPKGAPRQLEFSTIVRRTDRGVVWPEVVIPSVHTREFRERVQITVPWGQARLNLRAWTLTGSKITIRVLSMDGRELDARPFVAENGHFANGDFTSVFPRVPKDGRQVIIAIETDENSRVWAFVSASDYRTGEVRLHLPAPQGKLPAA